MARSAGRTVLEDVRSALEKALGDQVRPGGRPVVEGVDLMLRVADAVFAIDWKPAGDAANVGRAVRQLAAVGQARRPPPIVPLLAVPFMGDTGRRLCSEAGLSWIDLSGNAWVEAPGRRVRISGHRNRFVPPGRPTDVFAPRSSRVMRALLMEPERSFTQSELVDASGVDKGRVSRLVRRLERLGFVERLDRRRLRAREPALALDAWREAYDFERHDALQGHVGVRTSEELMRRIVETPPPGDRWAFSGLAAAWQLTRFAQFRLVTLLVDAWPDEDWLDTLGFREEPRGANLWVVRPNDDAVFAGARVVDGVPCAHPLQVYLDLEGHPERAGEAAGELRRRYLGSGSG